jgi:hypothetical protein
MFRILMRIAAFRHTILMETAKRGVFSATDRGPSQALDALACRT